MLLIRTIAACLLSLLTVSACGPKNVPSTGPSQPLPLSAPAAPPPPAPSAGVEDGAGSDDCRSGDLCDRAMCPFVTTELKVGRSGAVVQEHTCVTAGQPCRQHGLLHRTVCRQFRQRVHVGGGSLVINSGCGCAKEYND
ncbi:hypothetical protein FJT64_007370 [Amphibalanus amphitrite]|uniref:Uncharacterized protein n=1 Tax=Amphibalanus amphitrite TaxID=1232801 RepID=A0A6A4VYU5_AMPAM|nr:hypothetical protein FJT64_007370 [Amphibalanus amphitrite]